MKIIKIFENRIWGLSPNMKRKYMRKIWDCLKSIMYYSSQIEYAFRKRGVK